MEQDSVEEKTPVKKDETSEAQSETLAVEPETKEETNRAESPTTTVSTASTVKVCCFLSYNK